MSTKTLLSQYQEDFTAAKEIRDTFDEREKFIIGDIYDSVTPTTKSKVVDQTLLSGLIRRTNDTMAQMPTGVVRALSTKDKGKSLFMNLILEKYILPNANSQADIYTKFWLMEFLSLIYGKIDVLVDYVVKDNYVGPDFYIIPPRNSVPQAGIFSVDDADYHWVITYVSRRFLEKKKKVKGWKNIDKVLEQIKKGKKEESTDKTSYIERKHPSWLEKGDYIELVTKYEPDKWTVFSPQAEEILREIENPHKNGELPIVSKVCYPLIDRYFGLSEYERHISAQKTINSLINLFLDAQKMRIYPPLKLYLPDLVVQTIRYEAGAKWVLKNNNPNAISEMNLSPAPLTDFQVVYGTMKGAVLSGLGTSDTSVSQRFDVSLGKTPEALRMQQAMAASHTNFDRKMLEVAIERVYDKFIDLLSTKQEKAIELELFDEDLRKIQSYDSSIVEMFESKEGGKVTIKPQDVKGAKYKFFIDAGSTLKKDELVENQTLTSIISLIMKLPGAPEQIQQTGTINLGNSQLVFSEVIKRWLITSGIDEWDKIIVENKQEQQPLQQPMQPVQPQMGGQAPPVNMEENPLLTNLQPEQQQLANEILRQYGGNTNQI